MALAKFVDIESIRWRPPLAILAVSTFFVFLAVELFELPKNMMFWRELQNAGHFPVFGMLAILIIWLSKKYLAIKNQYLIINYILAIGIASILGLLLEIYQYFGPRDADWGDLVRDIAGAAAFCFVYLAYDRSLISRSVGMSKLIKPLLISLAFAMLIGASMPLIDLGKSYLQRNKSFPVICDFDESWQTEFVIAQGAGLEYVSVPDDWPGEHEGRVGKLTFFQSRYPGIVFREPVRDWTRYNTLCFDIYSELSEPFNLLVRVDDKHHNKSYSDRYNGQLEIGPGLNKIRIPFDQIRRGPRSREMDMANVSLIVLFVANPERSFSIYLDNIKLEN
jgi:hypothetical protein